MSYMPLMQTSSPPSRPSSSSASIHVTVDTDEADFACSDDQHTFNVAIPSANTSLDQLRTYIAQHVEKNGCIHSKQMLEKFMIVVDGAVVDKRQEQLIECAKIRGECRIRAWKAKPLVRASEDDFEDEEDEHAVLINVESSGDEQFKREFGYSELPTRRISRTLTSKRFGIGNSGPVPMNVGDEEFIGRLNSALESDPREKIDIFVVNGEGKQMRFSKVSRAITYLETLSAFKFGEAKSEPEENHSNAIWINVEGGNVLEISKLGRKLGLHPLTIEDCCAAGGRQKLEPFENYLFLVMKSLHHDYYSWDVGNPIKLLVFPNMCISFHRYPSFAIDVAFGRVRKLFQDRYLKNVQSMHILHTLTDTICDSDVPVVNIIEDETENLEEEVYGQNTIEENQNLLQKIGIAKRRIVRFRQLLWPKKDILMSLVQKENFDFLRSQINVAYFRDVYDHLVLMVQKLDADHEAIAGLEATHLARVSIEVSKVSNSMNQVMKQFSSVATIILPLSFITSLLGMNVPIPYQSSADYDSLAPFTVLSVLMISLVFFMIAFFRKKKWI